MLVKYGSAKAANRAEKLRTKLHDDEVLKTYHMFMLYLLLSREIFVSSAVLQDAALRGHVDRHRHLSGILCTCRSFR